MHEQYSGIQGSPKLACNIYTTWTESAFLSASTAELPHLYSDDRYRIANGQAADLIEGDEQREDAAARRILAHIYDLSAFNLLQLPHCSRKLLEKARQCS
jgi:hypothetical protein